MDRFFSTMLVFILLFLIFQFLGQRSGLSTLISPRQSADTFCTVFVSHIKLIASHTEINKQAHHCLLLTVCLIIQTTASAPASQQEADVQCQQIWLPIVNGIVTEQTNLFIFVI